MILMKDFLIEKAKAGIKTETRRLGKKRWSVGKVYWVCHKLYQKAPDIRILITGLWQEKLSQITPEAIKREGLEGLTPAGFIEKFRMINKGKVIELDPPVWVLQYELVKFELVK